MKKILFTLLTILVCCCACSKSCTCAISTNNQAQELEIAYNDDCSNYSNSSRTCK